MKRSSSGISPAWARAERFTATMSAMLMPAGQTMLQRPHMVHASKARCRSSWRSSTLMSRTKGLSSHDSGDSSRWYTRFIRSSLWIGVYFGSSVPM